MATDIEALTAQVAEQTASLESATALRDKEKAEFVADEKDMIQSITSLKGAVVVLGKAHSEVQMANSLLQVRNLLKRHTSKYNMITEALTRKQRHVVLSLLQESPGSGLSLLQQ